MVLVGQHCEMQQKCALLHEQWGEAVEVQVTFENMSSIFPPELRYFTDNVAWQEDRIKDKQQAWLFQWQFSLHVSVVQVSPKQMGALAPCDHTSNSCGHNYQLTGAAVSIGPGVAPSNRSWSPLYHFTIQSLIAELHTFCTE